MGDQLSPAMLAQIEALWVMKEAKQKEEMKDYIDMSRKASIEIKKRDFHRMEDKRAVGFICDLNYDLEDFFAKTKELLTNVGDADTEPQVVDVAENKEKTTDFIKYCVAFGAKMSKKLNRQYESHQVANNSRGGWATVNFFHQSDLFDKNLKEKSWLDREEEGSEEKAKRLRNAERQAALDQKEKAKFAKRFSQRGGSGRKRTRFDNSSRYSSAPSSSAVSATASPSSSLMFGPSQMYHPPGAAQVQCYGCQEFGHIRKYCPKNRK